MTPERATVADACHRVSPGRVGSTKRRPSRIGHHGPMTSRGIRLFALMAVIWGIPYLFIRVAVAEVSPSFLVLARTALAAAILVPIALARGGLRPILARWRWLPAFPAVEIANPRGVLRSAEKDPPRSLTRTPL